MRSLLQAPIIFLLLFSNQLSFSQSISQRLSQAVRQFESDPQMKHAITSLYVVDAKTGKKVYGRNEQIGLAPASTQKLFTSAAAFELLGKNFTYETRLNSVGRIDNGILKGHISITGSGDPTLGSWRYSDTKESIILENWIQAISKKEIKTIQGDIVINIPKWSSATIPDGWIWQDIGNYYGAGADGLNWRENQYDLVLRSGNKIGDTVQIVDTKPKLYDVQFTSEVTAGSKSSGDNAYIYLPPYAGKGFVRGTIPVGENAFTISGSFPAPSTQLAATLKDKLHNANISVDGSAKAGDGVGGTNGRDTFSSPVYTLHIHQSPPLDSINYYFMKRSINLYGEALVKTISLLKTDTASTEKGIEIVRDFWSGVGIEKSAIQIIDGSGLSPQNRVTTDAEVKVLQYARSRPWFQSFYNALPEYNGMKMKSGSIGGARAYAGYHKAKDGNEYIFSIIVNNYDGSAIEVVRKMYKVLNELK